MLLKNFIRTILILSLTFMPISISLAQEVPSPQPKQKIVLGVRNIDPFIMNKDNKYSGFSIDLWNRLAQDSNLETTEIKEYPNVSELLKALETKQVDAAIAAISITEDREKTVDFTTPMYNSGLSIMTKVEPKASSVTEIFSQIQKSVFNSEFYALASILAGISFILANILYLTEKRKDDGFLDEKNYISGITMAFWWGICALFGQQDRQPATKLGRLIGVLWMVFGVLFLAFFTGQITSNLTADKISGNINSIKDLKGNKIATVRGSTAQKYLIDNEYILKPDDLSKITDQTELDKIKSKDNNKFLKDNINDAAELLKSGEVEAVVYDAPALEFYVKSKGMSKLQTVGGLFTSENYGIALPSNSNLREALNLNLLKLQENGDYNKIKETYFGDSN